MRRGFQNSVLAPAFGAARVLLAVTTAVLVVWRFCVWVTERRRLVGPADSEAVELVLMHWSGGGGQEEDDIVQASIAEFEQRNPNIKVKRINPGDSGQYFTKLQTMMAAGEPPDIFYMDFARMAPFAEAGQLQELDGYFAAESDPDAEDPLILDEFFTPAVDAFRLEEGKMGIGPLFGVPKDFTTVGIYWNRDLFDQAGAQHPTPDWTWDDFVTAGRKVHALEGITGAELVTWPFVLRGYLWSRGASVVNDQGDFETLTLSSQESLQPSKTFAIGSLAKMAFWPDRKRRALTRIALLVRSHWHGGPVWPLGGSQLPKHRGLLMGFCPVASGESRANVLATIAWSMSSKSKHPEASWKLLKWLTGEQSKRPISPWIGHPHVEICGPKRCLSERLDGPGQ